MHYSEGSSLWLGHFVLRRSRQSGSCRGGTTVDAVFESDAIIRSDAILESGLSTAPSSKATSVPKHSAKSTQPRRIHIEEILDQEKTSSPATARAKRKRSSPRMRRMHAAFVASASLKPMARQLLQDRTPAAYTGVEAFARRHGKEDAGSLAWLVLGYAHIVDHDYVKAIDPLNRAKPRAGDLRDVR